MMRIFTIVLLQMVTVLAAGQSNIKALVGGTLIDGFGGSPLRNSVVIIEGQRIKAIGQVGNWPFLPTRK